MKKIFAFAIAAATMAVGCQKIQSLVNPNDNEPVDDGTPVPVVFGTNVATVSTKAAIDGTTFSGQELIIYGVNDATDDFLENMDPATATATGNEIEVSGAFYGVNKETYSFFGYHAGDATAIPTGSGMNVTVDVTINGDDDVLIGTADKANDIGSSGLQVTDLYSAKSARKGVKPNLTFNHMLARFDFKIVNGTTLENEETITIDKIGVNSVDKCTLNLAQGTIIYDETVTEPTTEFSLEPNLTFSAADGDTSKDAGSLMVMPGLTSYPLALTVTSNGNAATSNLKIQSTTAFTAGKNYEVTVKVYGSEAVVLSVTLVDWVSGDPITIDPDVN